MKAQKKTLAVVLGGAFAASLAVAPVVNAAENPFAIKSLSGGYQVAEHDGKAMEGKCGEGKCGANKKKAEEKAKDGKCGEGKCGANKKKGEEKAKDGSCGGEKDKEGSCSSKH